MQAEQGDLRLLRRQHGAFRSGVQRRREAFGAIQAVQDELYAAWEDFGREVSDLLEAPPSERETVLQCVFRACDVDGNQRLDTAEMCRLATCMGFTGGPTEWAETYAHLCKEHNCVPKSGLTFDALAAIGKGWPDSALYAAREELEQTAACASGPAKVAGAPAQGGPPSSKPAPMTIRELLTQPLPPAAATGSSAVKGGRKLTEESRQGGEGRPRCAATVPSAGVGEEAPSRLGGAAPRADRPARPGAAPPPAWLPGPAPAGRGGAAGSPARPGSPCDKWEAMQEDIDRVFGESHQELALLASRLARHAPAR